MSLSRLNRRQLLAALPGALLLPAGVEAGGTPSAPALLLSAATDKAEKHWIVGLDLQGGQAHIRFRQPLPTRGHHVAASPAQGLYVAVARRPGNWLLVGSLDDGRVLQRIRLPVDRHLYGHGIFTVDGSCFYTTESDYNRSDADNGLVVEWQVVNRGGRIALQRGREFASGGIGPHELALMPDGQTLVIANGGLRTHPDSGREVLNVDTMQPSLAYIDRTSGLLAEQHYLPRDLHQASIRHLDVSADGLVAAGMQYQGEPFHDVPLILTHRCGEGLRTFSAPPAIQTRMKQYVGSVRFDTSGDYFAASSPRGNLITCWRADGTYLRAIAARDGCGLLASEAGFVISTGTGRLLDVDLAADSSRELLPDSADTLLWDNHLVDARAGGGRPA